MPTMAAANVRRVERQRKALKNMVDELGRVSVWDALSASSL